MSSQVEILAALGEAQARHESLQALLRSGVMHRWSAVEACRANPALPSRAVATLFSGDTMVIDLREEVSRYLFTAGIFEARLTRFVCSMLKPGAVFADIGAHYGYYSKIASRVLGPEGRIYAFEPMPATLRILRENVRPLTNVEVVDRALWSENTTLSFVYHGQPWSAFASAAGVRLPAGVSPKHSENVEVQALTYDGFFSTRERRPSMVKIDVESAEMHVLKGMSRALAEDRPIVTVEVGDFEHLTGEGVPRSAEMLAALAGHDYALFELAGGGLRPHTIRTDAYGYDNIVGLPREFDLVPP